MTLTPRQIAAYLEFSAQLDPVESDASTVQGDG